MKSGIILIIVTFSAPHEGHMNIWPMESEQACIEMQKTFDVRTREQSDPPDHWMTYCLHIDESDLK